MKKLIALAGAATVLLWSSVGFACECQDTRDRDESSRTAKYVFYAEAVDLDGNVGLKVKTNFKGTKSKRTHPVAPAEGKDCSFTFEVGKKYIVFASKGEAKREVVVDHCGATTQLDSTPLTAVVWSLADELAYKTSRSAAEKHRKAQNTIVARAERKIKGAARACEPDVWKGKDEMKARFEVRFDVESNGSYTHEILMYETPSAATSKVKACLAENLAADNFKKFPGSRVSVSGYWLIDRLDASFGEDRASATVLPFKSTKHLLE